VPASPASGGANALEILIAATSLSCPACQAVFQRRDPTKAPPISIQRRVESLGGLHDSRLIAIDWSAEARRLRIVVDDLHANTRGHPGYPGPTQATVTFSEVSRLDVAAELTLEGLSIFEWSISLEGGLSRYQRPNALFSIHQWLRCGPRSKYRLHGLWRAATAL
jgi:hypothetical protein